MGRVSDAKERLLQAAGDLVWQQSYGSVTIDAICEKAGVKKGSFYYFFNSKSDLAVAALEAHWQVLKPDLDRIFSPTVPPLERIQKYFEGLYQYQKDLKQKFGHVMGCPFCSLGSELSQQDQEICGKVREIMTYTPKYMETALRDAQAAGLIHVADIPAKTKSIFAYMEGVLLQARIQDDVEMLRNLSTVALEMVGAQPALV